MATEKIRTMTIAGMGISCIDTAGTGIPLVMLHGSGASKGVFSKQFSDRSLRGMRKIAIDLPGHGSSDNAIDVKTYTFSGMASVVREVLEQLEVREPVILGWSLGGHVAIEMAAMGTPLSGLMLCGTPPLSRGPFSFLSAFQPKLDMLLATKPVFSADDARRFSGLIFGQSFDGGKLADVVRADGNCRATIAKATFRAEGSDQRRFIEKADLPVAIVNGASDPLIRLKYFRQIHAPHLWQGKCLEIVGAGHACFLDAPQQFNELLGRFIGDVESGRAIDTSPLRKHAS